jgi:hypothetical protein
MIDQTTLSGTYLRDGVEYLSFPPPNTLIKAMELRFAERFLEFGEMKFGSLGEYRTWENKALGDADEGEGMYRIGEHSYETGSINPIYVWCASDERVDQETLVGNSKEAGYDCIIRVLDPKALVKRIQGAIARSNLRLRLHCSHVVYDRGAVVSKVQLNKKPYLFNVFPKKESYAKDFEYRMALVDIALRSISESRLLLSVGRCSDIAVLDRAPRQEFGS